MIPDEVKRTLRALALGTEPTVEYEQVVERTAESLDRVEVAAEVCDDAGRARLRTAVVVARRHGDTRVARAGLRTLRALERYRRAAARSTSQQSKLALNRRNPRSGGGNWCTYHEPDDRGGPEIDDESADDDRSVRGTTLSGHGQRDDR